METLHFMRAMRDNEVGICSLLVYYSPFSLFIDTIPYVTFYSDTISDIRHSFVKHFANITHQTTYSYSMNTKCVLTFNYSQIKLVINFVYISHLTVHCIH